MTKVQALQAYGAAVLFAGVDAELAGEPLDIEDHEIKVQLPLELRKLCDLGPEAYAGKYWSR